MPTPAQAHPADSIQSHVRVALESIRPIVAMHRDGLTIIPLASGQQSRSPEYLTLDQARESKAITLTEAPQQTVPTIEALTGPSQVLLLDGDTIVGGAQNRIINVSLLLKAKTKTAIPVSCLEHGRWNNGRHFAPGRKVDHRMRRLVNEQIVRRRISRPSEADAFDADQGAIWREIGHKQGRAAHHSPTDALHDLYEIEAPAVEEIVAAFPMPARTRGLAIGHDDRLAGLDLFDSVETLERQWPRLIESAVLAHLDHQRAVAAGLIRPKGRHIDSGALQRMVGRAVEALSDATSASSVGLGHDVRFAGTKIVGTALVHDRRAVHVALFRP